jgi:hypothetical protein
MVDSILANCEHHLPSRVGRSVYAGNDSAIHEVEPCGGGYRGDPRACISDSVVGYHRVDCMQVYLGEGGADYIWSVVLGLCATNCHGLMSVDLDVCECRPCQIVLHVSEPNPKLNSFLNAKAVSSNCGSCQLLSGICPHIKLFESTCLARVSSACSRRMNTGFHYVILVIVGLWTLSCLRG